MTPTNPANETLHPAIQTLSVLSERKWMDVKETDKEIVVEAELPGIDEKDLSLALQSKVLMFLFEHLRGS